MAPFTGTIVGDFYLSNSDRLYTGDEINEGRRDQIGNGVAVRGGSLTTQLECAPVSATMQSSVEVGTMWIEGYRNVVSAAGNVTHAAADVTNPRIDIICIEKNSDNGTRASSVKIIEGTPAASPSAPALTQTSTIWQEALSEVLIPAGETDADNFTYTDRRAIAASTYDLSDRVFYSLKRGTSDQTSGTDVEFEAVVNDDDGIWQSGDPEQLPIPEDGEYLITWKIYFESTVYTTYNLTNAYFKVGGSILQIDKIFFINGVGEWKGAKVLRLSAGDYLSLQPAFTISASNKVLSTLCYAEVKKLV